MPTAAVRLNQDLPSHKLVYIDNIKVLLTVLVVLHHTLITYGFAEGWYYNEPTASVGAKTAMTLFVSINQSFFMGYFFMLAACFTGSSYARKGASTFIKDRLVRLGIPILFYSFVLSPFISYLVFYFAEGHPITYLSYLSGYDNWIETGVTWFVAALLLFTLVYVAVKKIVRFGFKKQLTTPKTAAILVFAVVLGIISFWVRIIFPVGWVLEPLGFQLGHFPQYIALFIVGLLAAKNKWLEGLSDKTGRQLRGSAWLCLLFFPVFVVIRLRLDMPSSWFSGGFHWQALLYAVWEQWIGISILTALLIRAKRNWNSSSATLARLSRCSFAVYIFHPLVIVGFSLAVRTISREPALKLLVVAPLAVTASFALGLLILRIPGVRKVL